MVGGCWVVVGWGCVVGRGVGVGGGGGLDLEYFMEHNHNHYDHIFNMIKKVFNV